MRDDEVYGLLTLGGCEVALPLSALREVVPCPPQLTPLPVSAHGLVGAMELRELVVPVVDLAVALQGAAATEDGAGAGPERVVVVVTDGEQLVGVLADRVRGVARVPSRDLLALRADGGPLLVSHTFRHPDGTGIVSVLDATAVLGLPGVPTVHDVPRAADGPPAAERRSGRTRTLTLLRCGGFVLGLDVAHVHTTLPGGQALASVLDSALCRGTTTYVDREVAVVDPLVLLGLGTLQGEADGPGGATSAGAGLVLDLEGGYVVLALSALLDIVEVDEHDVLAVPAFAVARPDLLAGMVEVPGTGQCLVLDGEALATERQLLALGSLNTATDGSELDPGADDPSAAGDLDAAAASRRTARPYITYTAGTEVATPLEQVSEILPLPTTHTPTSGGGAGGAAVVGVVAHRSAAVPVLHLPTLLGLQGAPASAASCVLLVEVDGHRVAFAVDALRDIEPLAWEDPEHDRSADPAGAGLDRVLHDSPLIQVGEDARLLRDLDLRALARAVRGPVPAVPGPREPQPELVGA